MRTDETVGFFLQTNLCPHARKRGNGIGVQWMVGRFLRQSKIQGAVGNQTAEK